MANAIGCGWKKLGIVLGVEAELEAIHEECDTLLEKAFNMLKRWTETKGSRATYGVLSCALEKKVVGRLDLSENYCYV